MKIRNYGLYDTVAKNMVSIFQSQSDDTCIRSAVKMVQDPNSDISLLKDCVCQYLFTVDSETGDVVESKHYDLFTMATLIEKFGDTGSDNKSLVQLRQDFDLIQKQFSSYKDLDSKCQKILDMFSQNLAKIDKKVNDIIGGKIKCQKFKKKFAK